MTFTWNSPIDGVRDVIVENFHAELSESLRRAISTEDRFSLTKIVEITYGSELC